MTSSPAGTPLLGRTVLVTRASGQASDLADMLRSLGAAVEHFAAITIAAPPSWDSLDAVIDNPAGWHWLVFTSTNGVDAFFARMKTNGRDSASMSGAKIAAVGRATANSLRERGVTPDILPEKFQAAEILPLLPADQTGVRTAVVRALEGRDELIDELRARGGDVHLAIAYETVGAASIPRELRARLVSGAFDALTFTSPSTAANLLRHLTASELAKVNEASLFVSIGPVTTKALSDLGVSGVVEAQEASVASLCEAIATHFSGPALHR
jgi:uroporphyrinogen III methyltransferase/synthase